MVGRRGRDHRHLGQDGFQRQDGLDPLAGEQHPGLRRGGFGGAKADAIAEEMSERPARIRQWCLLRADPIEPGAVNTGDPAACIGDGGKQSWP